MPIRDHARRSPAKKASGRARGGRSKRSSRDPADPAAPGQTLHDPFSVHDPERVLSAQRLVGNRAVVRTLAVRRARPDDRPRPEGRVLGAAPRGPSTEGGAAATQPDADPALGLPDPAGPTPSLPAAGPEPGIVARSPKTSLAQRQPAAAAPSKVAQLDELLDRWNTPEEEVIDLLGTMNATEKRTVIAGYRRRLAGALNFDEMRRAVIALGAPLPVKLDWLQAAVLLTSSISYSEIRGLVTSAPQGERDMLNNGRWRSFFTSVCDNSTILTAVADLHFDLPTQLRWVSGEANALLSLDLSMLRPLLTGASRADLATVSGDAWRPFWTDVCTNATVADLVDILFPDSLLRKLEWMAAEGSDLTIVQAKVAATTDAAQKLAVFASPAVRALMLSLCDGAEMINFVLSLGGDWTHWRDWTRAAGVADGDLAQGAVAAGQISEPSAVGLVRLLEEGGSATEARDYVRNLTDDQLATLRGDPMAADVIREAWGPAAEPVFAALDGELAAEEHTASVEETLLSGPPTSPFVERSFGGDHRFTIRYTRTAVHVDVGIALTPVDDRASELLPAAITTWRANIQGAWDNQFSITNGERTIPLRFHANLGSGPNPVNVHSGVWAWPELNAGNWFAPDPVNVPEQADAVARAPIHEFGHLIGNQDEYMLSAAHYIAVTGGPATAPGAVPETDTAGTTRYSNSVSVMGTGGPVLQRHVEGILTWVNSNLRAGEPPFSFAP